MDKIVQSLAGADVKKIFYVFSFKIFDFDLVLQRVFFSLLFLEFTYDFVNRHYLGVVDVFQIL
jgi:hypothetical protein